MLTAGWSVLTLYWLHRWLETDGRTALVGFAACWALQLFSNLYLGVFLAIPVGIVLLMSFARQQPRLSWRRAGALGAMAVVLLALNAPVLHQYSQAQTELGLSHSVDEVRRYSATLQSYASVWEERRPRWLWAESASDRALFPGSILVLLALVGVVSIGGRGTLLCSGPWPPLRTSLSPLWWSH